MSSGQFEAFVNSVAFTDGPEERSLIEKVRAEARVLMGAGDVRWAGSLYKRTAVDGSDLDIWISTPLPVTSAKRRTLAERLADTIGRRVTIKRHVIRLEATGDQARVDLSFGNCDFGPRPAPDDSGFRNRPDRQQAARALKVWSRSGGLPRIPGWVVEAFVVGADRQDDRLDGLGLFVKLLKWLRDSANPSAVETILRPAALPIWNPDWSSRLAGPLEALRNAARSTLARDLAMNPLRTTTDVDAWLRRTRQ